MRQIMVRPGRTNHYPAIDSFLNTFFTGDLFAPLATDVLAPRADVVEEKDRYRIALDLPGMKKKDIHIVLEDGVLSVSGERNGEVKSEEEGYRSVERAYGSFRRSFRLPDNVDTDSITAEYRDGVLTMVIAKNEEALPRQIEVKVK